MKNKIKLLLLFLVTAICHVQADSYCDAGKILGNEDANHAVDNLGFTPNLGYNYLYGIYNLDNEASLTINNIKSPMKTDSTESVVWNIAVGDPLNNVSNRKADLSAEGLSFKASYKDLLKPGETKLSSGDTIYVNRTYVSNSRLCTSNTVKFLVVDTLRFDGFNDDEKDVYLCQGKKLTLKGNDVDWQTIGSINNYYVEYGWEYKTDLNDEWKLIEPSFGNNRSIQLNKDFFSKDVGNYYFRQVIRTRNFNRTIYADNKNPFITVHLYKIPEASDFAVSEMPKTCEGELITDTLKLSLKTDASRFKAYKDEDEEEPEDMNFYIWYYSNPLGIKSTNLRGTKLNVAYSTKASRNDLFYIHVTDGCENDLRIYAPYGAEENISSTPTISASDFSVDKGTVFSQPDNYGLQYNYMHITAPGFSDVTLSLNNDDSTSSQFLYYVSMMTNVPDGNGSYLWGEPVRIQPSGFVFSQFLQEMPWYNPISYNSINWFDTYAFEKIKIEKVDKNTGCTSKPLYVCVNFVNPSILGNSISSADKTSSMFVCKGDKNKAVNGSAVRGGYNGSYSYLWQYIASGDSVWQNMKDNAGQDITSQNLAEAAWAKAIDQNYRIRRVAYSTFKTDSISSSIKSESDPIYIRFYDKPVFMLKVNGDRTDTQNVCYGHEVTFSSNVSNTETIKEQMFDFYTNLRFAYKGSDGKNVLFNHKKTIATTTRTYQAALLFCADTLYSTNSIELKTDNSIAKGWYYDNDDCSIRGRELNVTITPKKDLSYTIVYGADTIEGTKASLKLPEHDFEEITYHIIANDGKCKYTQTRIVSGDHLRNPLSPSRLAIESDGMVNKDGSYTVCAGNTIKLKGDNDDANPYATYEWYIDGKKLDSQANHSSSLTTSLDFDSKPGYITRKVLLKDLDDQDVCQSQIDSVKVNVFNRISNVINFPSYACAPENADLRVDPRYIKGGSGNYIYEWHKVLPDSDAFICSTEKNYTNATFEESTDFYVVVKDKNCTSNLYTATSSTESLKVYNGGFFTLKTSPSVLTKNSFSAGKVKVLVTSNDFSATDTVRLFLNDKDVTGFIKYGNGISVSLTLDDFRNNEAVFNVYRYANNKQCVRYAYVSVYYQHPDFDGSLKIFTTEPIVNPCNGKDITIKIDKDKLPTLNGEKIDAKRITYRWYKYLENHIENHWGVCDFGDSLNITFSNNENAKYRCGMFIDLNGLGEFTNNIFSNEIIVMRTKPAYVGEIAFTDAKLNKTFTQHKCKGETGTLTLSTIKKTIENASSTQWFKKGASDAEWMPLSSSSTSLSCKIDLADYNENTLFKLVATNPCGKETESVNTAELIVGNKNKLSEKDITIFSTTENTDVVPNAVSVGIPNDKESSFFWATDPEQKTWTSGNPVVLNNSQGFGSGEHSIFVYKAPSATDVCAPDTVEFRFNAFKKLTANKNIYYYRIHDALNNHPSESDLHLLSISGGYGKYTIDWYYKDAQLKDFVLVDKSKQFPFVIDTTESSANYLNLHKLDYACSFYAVLRDSSGHSFTTDTLYVKEPVKLRAGAIDTSTVTICYGGKPGVIIGDEVEKPVNNFYYYWIKAELQNDGSLGKWTSINRTGKDLTNPPALYKTTFIARVASDYYLKDTTLAKKVIVRNGFSIKETDVEYNPSLSADGVAIVWGVNPDYLYTWSTNGNDYCSSYEANSFHRIKSADTSDIIVFAKLHTKDDMHCLSSNYQRMIIKKQSYDLRTIAFNNFCATDENSKYIICSGSKPGAITGSGSNLHHYYWQYAVNGGETFALKSEKAEPISSCSVNLDTCNLYSGKNAPLVNNSGSNLLKQVSFFRTQDEFNTDEPGLNSDTITLYIVPTLQHISEDIVGGSLAGELSSEDASFCRDGNGEPINVTLNKKAQELWNKKQFGPSLYDANATAPTAWFEANRNGEWQKEGEENAMVYYPSGNEETYAVRRAISDGCTTFYSDALELNLADVKANAKNISISAAGYDGNTYTKGFEMGDTLNISYNDKESECLWFGNESCTDTLKLNVNLLSFATLNEETPYTVYMKRRDKGSMCYSDALAIPLSLFSKSNGGMICNDQKVTNGSKFTAILSGRCATGFSIAPNLGDARKFSYQWQISSDSSDWTNIKDATNPEELSAEKLNAAITGSHNKYFVRRMATNETGRTCFSDTVTLTITKKLDCGKLSNANSEKTAFCFTDTFPIIETTTPDGGSYSEDGYDGIAYNWLISTNGEDFTQLKLKQQPNRKQLNLDEVLRDTNLVDLDFEKDNKVYVRAMYSDADSTTYSESLLVNLYKKQTAPTIYLGADSCNAKTVTIKAHNAELYNLTWLELGNWDAITARHEQDTFLVNRENNDKFSKYGVSAIVKENGCPAPISYINIDRLPFLAQTSIKWPKDETLCYGSSYEFIGGTVAGNGGKISYQWQISYDKVVFFDADTTKDLVLDNLTRDVFVRRIIRDKCSADTSNTVNVQIQNKLKFNPDILSKSVSCEGKDFDITLDADKLRAIAKENTYKLEHFSVSVIDPDDTDAEVLLHRDNASHTFGGFEGKSHAYKVALTLTTSYNTCYGDTVDFTVYAPNPVNEDLNTIACDTLNPCNGTKVSISGKDPANEDDNVSYRWYTSSNKSDWTQIASLNGVNAELVVKNTMFVKRVADNGCEKKSSNILSFKGKTNERWDYFKNLDMEVATILNDSSSTVELIVKDAKNYEFFSNGNPLKLSSGKNVLPYPAEVYIDTILEVHKTDNDVCYDSYQINPIRGGRIELKHDGYFCPNSSVYLDPTNLADGYGGRKFRWQKKEEGESKWTDIPYKIYKDYSAKVTEVPTLYRRVNTDEVWYTSYSNEVLIVPEPAAKFGSITTDHDADYYADLGLELTDNSVQKLKDMTVVLSGSIENAVKAKWQYSYSNSEWYDEKEAFNPQKEVPTLTLKDENPLVYYRLSANNGCTDYASEPFAVTTALTPEIDDKDIVIRKAVCAGKDAIVACYDNADHNYSRDFKYVYSGYKGNMVATCKYENRSDFYTKAYNGTDSIVGYVTFKKVTEPFTLTITRISMLNGISTTRKVDVPFTDFKADFTYTIDEREHDLTELDVEMEQGARVQFNNKTEDATSFYWELIQAPNPELAGAGKTFGLESSKENPSCYFYNGGRYKITLIANNNSGCADTVVSNALHIPANAVHALKVPIVAEFVTEGEAPSVALAKVYPTLFSHELVINYQKKDFHYSIYSADGRLQLMGRATDRETLNTSSLAPGTYLVKVDGWLFKVVKE